MIKKINKTLIKITDKIVQVKKYKNKNITEPISSYYKSHTLTSELPSIGKVSVKSAVTW